MQRDLLKLSDYRERESAVIAVLSISKSSVSRLLAIWDVCIYEMLNKNRSLLQCPYVYSTLAYRPNHEEENAYANQMCGIQRHLHIYSGRYGNLDIL